mgnify:CR=1 FL=1
MESQASGYLILKELGALYAVNLAQVADVRPGGSHDDGASPSQVTLETLLSGSSDSEPQGEVLMVIRPGQVTGIQVAEVVGLASPDSRHLAMPQGMTTWTEDVLSEALLVPVGAPEAEDPHHEATLSPDERSGVSSWWSINDPIDTGSAEGGDMEEDSDVDHIVVVIDLYRLLDNWSADGGADAK